MRIPDFSKPSKNCFLTVDKNGTQIKEGDTLVSFTIPLRGFEKVEQKYEKVINYNGNLVIPIKPSFMLNYFAAAHCEIKNN